MKKLLPAVCLLAVLAVGCARHYTITTANGTRVTAYGKPKLKDGAYIYTDRQGKVKAIPASRIREIAPSSDSKVTDFTSGGSR